MNHSHPPPRGGGHEGPAPCPPQGPLGDWPDHGAGQLGLMGLRPGSKTEQTPSPFPQRSSPLPAPYWLPLRWVIKVWAPASEQKRTGGRGGALTGTRVS